MRTLLLKTKNFSEVSQRFKIGLKVKAKPIFPAKCNIVNGICRIKALKKVCPNIGANKTPVIKSKIIVAKKEKITKLKSEA